MPRRTTLPVWTVPTSGPSGPHNIEELLELNAELKPWAAILTVCTEARSRQLEILNRLREANYTATEVCVAGSPLLEWIVGMISDASMMFDSFESVIVALDRYIAKHLDANLTNASLETVANSGINDNAGQFPVVMRSAGMVTKDKDR